MQQTEYEASTAWSSLDAVKALIDAGLEPEGDDERYAVRRLVSATELADLYRGAEPTLVEPAHLNEVETALQQMRNSIEQYNQQRQRNRSHLTTAAASPVSNLVTALLTHFPTPGYNEVTGGMRGALTRYRGLVDQQVGVLEAEIETLRETLAATKQESADASAAAGERLTEIDATVTQHAERFAALNENVQAQMATQASQFAEETARRDKAALDAEETRNEAQAEALSDLADAAAEARTAEKVEAEEVLAALREHESQAQEILGSTGRHARSGGYGQWAEHQGRAAFWWTVAAVAIGLGVVAGLIWAMSSAADDSVQFVIYKISVGVLAAAVAGYAAKQAAEHRTQERRYKRLALDVATVEPFLATLEDPGTIRSDFAKRVFAPEVDPDAEAGDKEPAPRFSVSEIIDLLRAARG